MDNHFCELSTFEIKDHKDHDPENDIDPDNTFYSNMNINCKYYSDDEYNSMNTENSLSIIHFNSRSMYKNVDSIKEYLQKFKSPFSIITISETWFNQGKGIDCLLDGYELSYRNRENKSGGGVAININKNINYKIVGKMMDAIEGLLECISIEIICEKKKNIIITCLYRTPGSSIELFMEWLEKLYLNTQKILYITGDFNIDLINHNRHKITDDFINHMYSMGLFPAITRPSRITAQSATLIDNIFTNDIERIKTSGLMICDITDHLPVFTLSDNCYKKIEKTQKYIFKRILSDRSIEALKHDLEIQDWKTVLREKEVDNAYNLFLDIFCNSYNKCCPLQKYTINNKSAKCPWISKGLQNACKKKK